MTEERPPTISEPAVAEHAPAKPAAGPSAALFALASATCAYADAMATIGAAYADSRERLLAQMKQEGVLALQLPDREGPLSIESGTENRAVSKTILNQFFPPEAVEKVWKAAEKPYERLRIPKPRVDGPTV